MLNYQSTSYHDAMAVRRLFGLSPAPEFAAWLESHGLPAACPELSDRSEHIGDRSAQRHMLEQVASVLEHSERLI